MESIERPADAPPAFSLRRHFRPPQQVAFILLATVALATRRLDQIIQP